VVTVLKPKVDETVVEMFEDLLDAARRGEVTAALVVADIPGSTKTVHAGEWSRPKFIYALRLLEHRVLMAAIAQSLPYESEEPDPLGSG
jgi:hypothetical protein